MTIEVKDDPLEVGFVENLLVFSRAEQESGATNVVDETRNAFGVVVKGGDKGVGKKLAVVEGGELEVVFDVRGGFCEVEGGQRVTLALNSMEKSLMKRFRIDGAGRRIRVLPKAFQRRLTNLRVVFTVIDHPFGYAQGRLSSQASND